MALPAGSIAIQRKGQTRGGGGEMVFAFFSGDRDGGGPQNCMVVSESMDRVCRERPAEENLRRSIASTNLATLRNDGAIINFFTKQEIFLR